MAVLSIREYSNLTGDGALQIAKEPAIASQSLSITGTSAQSAAFNAATRYVRIQTDVRASLEFGASPEATPTSCVLAAGATEYFGVTAGQKVAGITA
jgi:hypothetical protein